MVKPEPTLAELDLEDGEKILNWMDDDYAMEVLDERLYNRDADYVLDNLVALNDRKGQIHYYPSLAESGQEVIKIALPKTVKLSINAITRYHNQRRLQIVPSQTTNQPAAATQLLDPAKTMRVLAVIGMAIYEFRQGCEIDSILHNTTKDQIGYNINTVQMCSIKDLSSFEDKYTLRVSETFKTHLNTWSEDVGIQSQTMVGYWILLALRTHKELHKWRPVLDPSIQTVKEVIEFKLKLLRLNSNLK